MGLLAIVLAQALLGMLTVTWQLTPFVVTLHLLLGFTTLSLLLWLVLSLPHRSQSWQPTRLRARTVQRARLLALFALIALGVQIALGGWTSSNYAAVACPDFPTCQAQWWPAGDYRAAFELRGASGHSYEGGVLDTPARTAIQVTHRLGALVITLVLASAAVSAWRLRTQLALRAAGLVLVALGAPPLHGQHGEYIERQLAAFAEGMRQNDINEQMRVIAQQLTPAEMHAVAVYYGAAARPE